MNQKKDSLKQRYQEILLEKQKADKNSNEVEKQKKLQELENWIANGTGIQELDGRTIFLSHDQVFIIKAKPRFWEKELHLEKKITEGGVQSFGKFQLDIPKKLINATLRFPRPGDYFH